MPDGSLSCTLGRLQAEAESLREALQRMRDEQEESRAELRLLLSRMEHKIETQDGRLRKIEDTLLTARASWRMVIFAGSAITTVAGIGAWAVNHFYDTFSKLAKSVLGW